MEKSQEPPWWEMKEANSSDPMEIARKMGSHHAILQEALLRQENLLQSLMSALHEGTEVQKAESFGINGRTGSFGYGEVAGHQCSTTWDEDAESPVEKDEENDPDVPDEKDETAGGSWPWPSGEKVVQPKRNRPPLKRSKRESILAPGADMFANSPSTASMHAVLKKRSFSSSMANRAQDSNIPILRTCLVRLVALTTWCAELKEPERTSCFARVVDGSKFSTLCLLVILANAILIIIVSDYEIQHLGEAIPEDWEILELSLTIFYGCELLLKISVHRLYFFVNEEFRWNIFDFFLVVFSFSEVAISRLLVLNQPNDNENSASLNVGFLRLLRLTKLAKVLRVFRTLKFFTELRLMIDCVLGSFMQIFWCLVMIVFVLYVFSLLIVQGIADFLLTAGEENVSVKLQTELMDYFGSVGETIMTLFQSTTAGLDWREAFKVLREGGWFLAVVFLVYISIFTISVWNIVTSTFVEKAMKLAKPDLDSMLLEQSMRDLQDSEELEKLFKPYAFKNKDGEDEISLDDLQEAADEAEFLLYLSVRGIDVKNVKLFFYMLGSMREDNNIDLKSLVKACVRMKGFATSIDLQSVSFEAKLMHTQVKELLEAIGNRIQHLEVPMVSRVESMNGVTGRSQAVVKPSHSLFQSRDWAMEHASL